MDVIGSDPFPRGVLAAAYVRLISRRSTAAQQDRQLDACSNFNLKDLPHNFNEVLRKHLPRIPDS